MKTFIVFLSCVFLVGCASPGIQCRIVDDNTAIFEPVKSKSLLSWLFPAKFPAGAYSVEQTEHGLKAAADTKVDLKLVNIDWNALKTDD